MKLSKTVIKICPRFFGIFMCFESLFNWKDGQFYFLQIISCFLNSFFYHLSIPSKQNGLKQLKLSFFVIISKLYISLRFCLLPKIVFLEKTLELKLQFSNIALFGLPIPPATFWPEIWSEFTLFWDNRSDWIVWFNWNYGWCVVFKHILFG